MRKILIVGAGFSGAVIARELSEANDYQITVLEERSHIAGNCYTTRDNETNIMEHVYGPHIFNTNNKDVWDYIKKFGNLIPYTNRVKAVTDYGVFSLPINLLTINQFFNRNLNPEEAVNFIANQGDKTIITPKNFEEQALKLIGKQLYEAFFKGYTIKQWGCDPKELPASILNRLPIRFNYDDNYYNSIYQGIPENGYTEIVSNLLNHPNIIVELNVKYERHMNKNFDYIFYSGPLDAYFNFSLGRLSYRTIFFEKHIYNGADYQGNSVINYCSTNIPYTRIHEHKHFTPWEKHDQSIYFKEYSKETKENDTPFYPKRLNADKKLLKNYRKLAENEENVSFIGRLGTYRYMDMHHVIAESLSFSKEFINWKRNLNLFKTFPNEEN